jgi:hypothetical protein
MGVLQWWANDPRVTIPEQAPGSLIGSPQSSSLLGFANQTPGALSQLAFKMAGSPKRPPFASTGYTTPPTGIDYSGGVGGGGGLLGSANQLNSTYKQGNSLYQNLLGGSSLDAAGSGVLANNALADAGFGAGWTTPVLDTGASAAGVGAGLSAVGGSGTGALGASTFAEFSPSSAAAIDAAAGGSSAGGGALAASGISTALPIAAIGWAVADALNKSGDIKSGGTSALLKGLVQQSGWTLKDPRTQTYQLPDGRFIRPGNEARAVSEALRKGDPNAQQLFDAWLATAKPPKG